MYGDGREDRVWDFNIRLHLRETDIGMRGEKDAERKRWGPLRWTAQKSKTRFIGRDQPSVVPKGEFLQDSIIGTLPYYETRCPTVPETDGRVRTMLRGSPIMAVGARDPGNAGFDEVRLLVVHVSFAQLMRILYDLDCAKPLRALNI